VTGASVFPPKELLHSFRQCKEGAVLNRSLLVEGLADVEKKYREKGYIFIYLDPEYHDAANRRVNVDIKVTEGDKFYLGRVEITGNTSTREKVIRRELTLDEGQVMDMEAFKKSLLKIQQLGYFKVSEEPDFKVRPEEKKVDVTIKGQEASRNEIQFGAGYSALDGFFAQFSFATRNFLGRGEILSLGFQRGSVSNFYNLSYTIPWFLDRNQTVGFSIFNNDLTYIDIDERRKGASLIYGRAIGIFDSWSVAYTYEDVHSGYPVQGAPIPPGQPVPPAAISRFDGTTSSFTPGYRYDSRNDPFDPTAGSAFSAALQVAGGPLGGTSYFLKPTIGGTTYIPFLRHKYFALHGELGYIATFGGRELPPFERFLIGDPSVRGFGIGRIVPLHDNNTVFVDDQGRLLGGTKYFIGNLEYIFAQAGPVKLLAFLDVAENWAEGQRLGFSKVRSSTGLELRLTLPIFQAPLRFIYSINLHPIQPLDQFGFPISTLHERRSGFDFSIGSSF
jgi:outer membrane protein insertion porin family